MIYEFPEIRLRCFCGVQKEEQQYAQDLQVSLKIEVNLDAEQVSDLSQTVDYFKFISLFMNTFYLKNFVLLEELAAQICDFSFREVPQLQSVEYAIRKTVPFSESPTVILKGRRKK